MEAAVDSNPSELSRFESVRIAWALGKRGAGKNLGWTMVCWDQLSHPLEVAMIRRLRAGMAWQVARFGRASLLELRVVPEKYRWRVETGARAGFPRPWSNAGMAGTKGGCLWSSRFLGGLLATRLRHAGLAPYWGGPLPRPCPGGDWAGAAGDWRRGRPSGVAAILASSNVSYSVPSTG